MRAAAAVFFFLSPTATGAALTLTSSLDPAAARRSAGTAQPARECRYVALNTLLNSAKTDLASVQRHRAMIVECVKDADSTIRRRALDLVYCLVSDSNVEVRARTRSLPYTGCFHAPDAAAGDLSYLMPSRWPCACLCSMSGCATA